MKKIITLVTTIFILTTNAQVSKLSGKQVFGGLRARKLGPTITSGRLTDIAVHPKDNNTIYVGSAGGGVWKSQNGGFDFTPVFDKHNSSIGSIAIDPKNPNQVVWVGTGESWTRNSTMVGDGLYKTTDGGANWKKMGFEDSERISSIVIHPEHPNTVYVAVLGHLWGDYNKRGVFKTTDGGKTWEKILNGNADTGVSDLVMDPNNPEIMYAALWQFRRTPWSFNSGDYESKLLKTTDGGKT